MPFLLPVLLIVSVTPNLADGLTLHRVILSSRGIGCFEYDAHVDGDATLGLDVRLGDVDDVLDSLVVFDTAGGVSTVTLPSRDESHAAFGALPVGRTALRSPISYLNDLRGVEVTVTRPQDDDRPRHGSRAVQRNRPRLDRPVRQDPATPARHADVRAGFTAVRSGGCRRPFMATTTGCGGMA